MPYVISSVPGNAERISFLVDQAAHGFAVGNAITLNAGVYTLAQADDADTLAVGLVSRIETNSFEYVSQGDMDWTAHGLTVETTYYLSDATPGTLTTTPPSTLGNYSQDIVYVMDANTVRVQEYRPTLLRVNAGIDIYTATADYAVGDVFEWDRTSWRVNTAITNAPATPPMGSIHAIARNFDQGDNNSGGNNRYQILLGYQNSLDFPSWISSRHSSGAATGEVRINVNQGGQTEAFASGAANLRIIGTGQAHLTDAAGAYVAPTSNTHIATKKFVDDKTGGGTDPDPDSGYDVLNGLSITAGQQYTISTLSQNQANYWCIGLRYASGVTGVQALDITSSFKTSGTATANFQVMANGINGTKIADLLRIHYASSAYRISFRAAVTATINIGSYGRNMTGARNQRASGLGTAVSTGTNYGSVAL